MNQRERTTDQSKEMLEALVNATMEALILLDSDGVILFINEVAAEKLGRTSQDLIGTSVYTHLPSETARIRKERYDACVATGESCVFESAREGRYFREHCYPVLNGEGRVSKVAIFASDITEQKQTETALRESERKYRSLFENANDATFLVKDGICIDCSANSSLLFGCTRADLIGHSPEEFSPLLQPDGRSSREGIAEKVNAAVAGPPQFFEWQHHRKDGALFDAEVSLNGLVVGGETCVQVIIRDVSARKRAERLLAESEERYRILTEKSTVGIYVIRDDLFRYVNKAFTEIFGYPLEEIVDTMNPLDPVVPEDRATVTNRIERRIKGETLNEHYEFRIRRRDGAVRHVEVFGTVVTYGGKPAILGTLVDVTERREMEEQLAAERRRFRVLSEEAPYGMAMIDAGGHFTYVNPRFKELFGYTLDDIPDGRTWFRMAYPDPVYRHLVISAWLEDTQGREAGEMVSRVYTVICKDGTEKIINFVPVRVSSAETIMSCRDITEQTKAEQDRERLVLELKDALVKVKTLSGLLPVCASCKRIRNDKGHWEQMEVYIRDRSEAEFSHGICPECMERIYGEYLKKK